MRAVHPFILLALTIIPIQAAARVIPAPVTMEPGEGVFELTGETVLLATPEAEATVAYS